MKPLVVKEIRLLLPAYVVALLLTVTPALLPSGRDQNALSLMLALFAFGAVVLALSSFGREFSLRTFPMVLAQPMERRRIWWTKIMVLAPAMTTLYLAWCIISAEWFDLYANNLNILETLALGATIMAAALSGALWTTMLLRQIMAAFWFTVLIPLAILGLIGLNQGGERAIYIAMGIYSVAGFGLAWWQFNRAQETGWTGGEITLPGWGSAESAGRFSKRSRRPFAALFWKELQLQQMGLLGMVGLFVVHLGVVWLRKVGHYDVGDLTRTLLEVFAGIWFIVPVLNACMSIAEERRLGTTQELLTLPVSICKQFVVKFVLTLVISGILSATLAWTAEWIGSLIGAGSGFAGSHLALDRGTLLLLMLYFLGLSLVGFYASSLARGIVQALAAAIATATILQLFTALVLYQSLEPGMHLVRGYLVIYIGLPMMVAALLWLSWKNFRSASENWHFWRRNILGLGSAFLLIVIATTAIYNRVWELVMPEPAHGQARLTLSKPPVLESYGGHALTAVLPDGRLWTDQIVYDFGRLILGFEPVDRRRWAWEPATTGFAVGAKWQNSPGNHIVDGTNWLQAVTTLNNLVAIRKDGTLWSLEHARQQPWGPEGTNRNAPKPVGNLVQCGSGMDWKSAATMGFWPAAILLKQDGTLWNWIPGYDKTKEEWTGFRGTEPRILSKDGDWDRTLSGHHNCVYGWKKDGSAWRIRPGQAQDAGNAISLWSGLIMERAANLDNTRWRSIAGYLGREIGLRDDGTLWTWTVPMPFGRPRGQIRLGRPSVVQIAPGAKWIGLAGSAGMCIAINEDGTLWALDVPVSLNYFSETAEVTWLPTQLGRHNDWFAVADFAEGVVSLSADGGLWCHWDRLNGRDIPQPMIAPPRIPTKIGNVLDQR